ncbi:MAG: TonB-dependent receptor [Ferruginibacter sp.]
MKIFFLMLTATFSIECASAQSTFKAQVIDANNNEPLLGSTAFIQGTNNGSRADTSGIIKLKNIPGGKQIVVFGYIGYKEKKLTLNFPLTDTSTQTILLETNAQKMDEVVVSTTRSSRAIWDIPTRVETITSGELNEKTTMQPANVKMILTESTGIQIQQTSATSANSSIRIQGLDGKYTQLLKDGFPLYSGFSGGLSIVQIPPLDLKRVEVIKGASSTLYGGGAIAGLINFVTKVPIEKRELSFLINDNSTRATDISGFYSEKFKKVGITIFASQNNQAAYDADKDGLSDIPKYSRVNFNPKIYCYINPASTLSFGINSSFENRLGGDMQLINNKADSIHPYFEKNVSNRVSSHLNFETTFTDKSILTFKNSICYFDRSVGKPGYIFFGKQVSSFSELNYLLNRKKSEWVMGGNVWTDHFKQTSATLYPLNSSLTVGGVFVQNTFRPNKKLILESGLRADATSQKDFFVLPRVSLLYKITSQFSTRIGGGLGYNTPTIFSEEAEEKGFKNIQPLDLHKAQPENSIGGNFDFNYRTSLFDNLSFSINQMFFYTRLNKPLILNDSVLSNGNYEFKNVVGYLDSKGFETNVKLKYDDVALYCGYTFIGAIRHFNNTKTINPLTAKNRIYTTLTYEIEDKLQVGYELFYTGQQQLSSGETRPDYWIMGISAQYKYKHVSLFVNAENFTGRRQTRYESIYTGTLQNPQFKEIWAPTDGFMFNGGFKISL